MNGHRVQRALLFILLLLAAGQRLNAAPSSAASGIEWYKGGVTQAFEAARANHKPVLLYWGAKWCPPCHELKSFVFTRKDFIEKSRQFVPVYLDGDDAGAQSWGERFHVMGYPTLVILRSDQVEITRLSGGSDLALYADVLDTALSNVSPIKDVLATVRKTSATLPPGDCRRLAYYPWDERDFLVSDPRAVAHDLESAARKCAGSSSVEHARLIINSALLATTAATTTQVVALVHDNELATRLVDVLENLPDRFFADVQSRGTSVTAQFQNDWIRAMNAGANDPTSIDADRLYAIATKLKVVKQFSSTQRVPEDMARSARAEVASALARKVDPYVRTGIVNSASHVYDALDDNDAMFQMLQREVKSAKAPYYYMVDLGELEEKRGNKAEALSWYERGYRESTGTATRFQWGCSYLSALLRLRPRDHDRIREVGIQVISELNGPNRIHARSRRRLEKLDGELRQWNAAHLYDADIDALRLQMRSECRNLPSDDTGRSSCESFLG